MNPAKFVFPAVKGIQANMEYYVTMIPLECLSKLFIFSNEALPPEIRAQRMLNKSRIPEMCEYILQNPTSYVFSSLTASVDGDLLFEPVDEKDPYLGTISIDMSAKLLINDGQHRRAAIEAALRKNPDLKYEHISMVLYHDLGLKRSQQMFSDLNRHAIRPTKSLNILFDNRDDYSILVKNLVEKVEVFNGLVDTEHTSIPNRSTALFTLSAIYRGTLGLLQDSTASVAMQQALAVSFWQEVCNNMPEWQDVKAGKLKSSAIRKESLSSLSITIRSIGTIGRLLINKYPAEWEMHLTKLKSVDWKKSASAWQDGIVVSGSVISSRATQQMMTEILKKMILDR